MPGIAEVLPTDIGNIIGREDGHRRRSSILGERAVD
jgi:hypothetical protein